jgi:SAM-dependent methyltransferase
MSTGRSTDAQMQAHYARGREAARLADGLGLVELERTKEVVLRVLPPAPAVVADVGGGPGRYAQWLAGLGYRVEHRDLAPGHVEHLAALRVDRVTTRVADARRLDLPDGSVDAVLLLGPLYHLPTAAERVAALVEAARVLRPGGAVVAAAISRWAPRLHGLVAERLYEDHPAMASVVETVEQSGELPPLYDGAFCGYTHRPDELAAEVRAAGLELVDLVGVEGVAFALDDLTERLADPAARAVVLESARAVERVPELLGMHPHLLATGRRPAAD